MEDQEKPVNLENFDVDFIKSFLPVYLKEINNSLNIIQQSLQEENFEQVRLYAHKIAGSSRLIKAIKIGGYSEKIENSIIEGNHDVKQYIPLLIEGFHELKAYCIKEFNVQFED